MNKNTERYSTFSKEIDTKIKQEIVRIGKKKISLIKDKDETENELFSLPFFVKVSKHGFYSEYAIHTIRVDEENKIVLDGTEKGELSDDESLLLDDCQELYSLCQVADLLSEM